MLDPIFRLLVSNNGLRPCVPIPWNSSTRAVQLIVAHVSFSSTTGEVTQSWYSKARGSIGELSLIWAVAPSALVAGLVGF